VKNSAIYAQALAKYNWAKKHLDDLDADLEWKPDSTFVIPSEAEGSGFFSQSHDPPVKKEGSPRLAFETWDQPTDLE
jgi:hypothetical protein